ncbi:MAG: hypothetical protein WC054_02665 [Candidatus Nanopelagicales bacterium]
MTNLIKKIRDDLSENVTNNRRGSKWWVISLVVIFEAIALALAAVVAQHMHWNPFLVFGVLSALVGLGLQVREALRNDRASVMLGLVFSEAAFILLIAESILYP